MADVLFGEMVVKWGWVWPPREVVEHIGERVGEYAGLIAERHERAGQRQQSHATVGALGGSQPDVKHHRRICRQIDLMGRLSVLPQQVRPDGGQAGLRVLTSGHLPGKD